MGYESDIQVLHLEVEFLYKNKDGRLRGHQLTELFTAPEIPCSDYFGARKSRELVVAQAILQAIAWAKTRVLNLRSIPEDPEDDHWTVNLIDDPIGCIKIHHYRICPIEKGQCETRLGACVFEWKCDHVSSLSDIEAYYQSITERLPA
jgi:hypothetical protein